MNTLLNIFLAFLISMFTTSFADASAKPANLPVFTLSNVQAFYLNGSEAPAKKVDSCRQEFKPYINNEVIVKNNFDPHTNKGTVEARFRGQVVTLYPIGIAGQYTFMSDNVGGLSQFGIFRIVFTMNQHFTSSEVDVYFARQENPELHDISCMLYSH